MEFYHVLSQRLTGAALDTALSALNILFALGVRSFVDALLFGLSSLCCLGHSYL